MLHCLLSTKFVYAPCINTRFNTISGSNNLTLDSYIFPRSLLTKFKTATSHCVMKTVVKSSDAFRGSTSTKYRSGGCSCSPLVLSITSNFYFSDIEEGLRWWCGIRVETRIPHHHHTINTPSPHHHHTITTPSPHHQHTINTPSPHHHHTINTPPARYIKSHHITPSVITLHIPNSFKSQDINIPFLFSILSFRRVLYIVCFLLGVSPASEV